MHKIVLFAGAAVTATAMLMPATGDLGSARAQQFQEPFRFRVHNNPMAANRAMMMENVDRRNSAGAGGVGALGPITTFSATTIGNLNTINTLLEEGAQGYVDLTTDQDGSGASQNATTKGTQNQTVNNNGDSAQPPTDEGDGNGTTETVESTNQQ